MSDFPPNFEHTAALTVEDVDKCVELEAGDSRNMNALLVKKSVPCVSRVVFGLIHQRIQL